LVDARGSITGVVSVGTVSSDGTVVSERAEKTSIGLTPGSGWVWHLGLQRVYVTSTVRRWPDSIGTVNLLKRRWLLLELAHQHMNFFLDVLQVLGDLKHFLMKLAQLLHDWVHVALLENPADLAVLYTNGEIIYLAQKYTALHLGRNTQSSLGLSVHEDIVHQSVIRIMHGMHELRSHVRQAVVFCNPLRPRVAGRVF
jgi:hypothetical protein